MKITPVSKLKFNNLSAKSSPISFKGFDCPEDSFEIKRVYNLPCPICGRTMIQQNQKESFVADCKNATGSELINLLSKYRKYFHETEAKVADILAYEATLHPGSDMLELSGLYLQKYLEDMKLEQLNALTRIKKLAGNLSNNQKAQLEAIIGKYSYIIQNDREKFNKTELENEINQVIPNFHSSRKKISKLIEKLPTINDEEYKFLKRYGQKSTAELASNLLAPSLATCEHIKPKSQQGANNTENYLAQCKECNSLRNDTPFLNWITGKNGILNNLEKYIKLVAGKIESGEISSDYVDYPSDIAKTILVQTNGKIKLEAPEIELSKDAVKLNFETKIAQLKKSIEDIRNDLHSAKKLQIKTKNSNQFRLYLEYVELQKEKDALTNQKQDLAQKQKKLRSLINEYYTNVLELRELQKNVAGITNYKEQEKAKNKIVSLTRSISLTKIEEKEEEADELGSKVADICLKLNMIETKLQSLRPKINFSSQYQEMINDIKVEIFELTGLLDKLSEKNKVKKEISELNKQAREKERKIKELTDINQTLLTDDSNNSISEYKKMSMIMSRADFLKETCQKTNEIKSLEVDNDIFEYAKLTALANMKKLRKENPAVQKYVNLEEIETLSNALKQIYAKIEQLSLQLKEFEEIQKTVESRKSINELQREISELNIKLAGAKEVEASVDIEQKIQALEDELERKTSILEKIENKELSEEEFIRIFSEA